MQAADARRQLGRNHRPTSRRTRGAPSWPQVGARQGGVAEKGADASAGRAGGKGRRCMRQGPRGAGLGVRLHGGPGRLGGHRRLRGTWRGRLMRHFLPLPPRGLPRRMGVPPVSGALVAAARLAHRLGPSAPAAPTPAGAPAPVARRAEEEDLPALGPAAHPEAQRLHETPARAGFWRRAPECATSCPPARPIRTPGRAVSGRPSSRHWRAFCLLGRTQLPTPPAGRATHSFLATGPGGDALRGQGPPGDRSKNMRFVETINSAFLEPASPRAACPPRSEGEPGALVPSWSVTAVQHARRAARTVRAPHRHQGASALALNRKDALTSHIHRVSRAHIECDSSLGLRAIAGAKREPDEYHAIGSGRCFHVKCFPPVEALL